MSHDPTTQWEIRVPLVVEKRTGFYPLTMNARLHWRPKAKLVAQIRESVAWHAKGMRIPPQASRIDTRPCGHQT